MNKTKLARVAVACLTLFILGACQQDDTNETHKNKPDGYIEPVPIKIIEEEPLHVG